MNMSAFDPDSFLQAPVEGASSTRVSAFPEGDYIAVIDDVGVNSGTIKRGDRAGDPWVSLDITYRLTDFSSGNLDEIAESIGRGDKKIRQGVFLDITAEGGIDMSEGSNVRLGRLREAVGQNVEGTPWSPGMLRGAGPLVIRVTQSPDQDDPETVYNRVTRTAPFSDMHTAA